MGTQIKDRTGQRHGLLTVVKPLRVNPKTRSWIWLCRCDCGGVTEVDGRLLRGDSGTKTCGCRLTETNRSRDRSKPSPNRKHGESGATFTPQTPEFRSWRSMRQRCNDKNHSSYKNYGGRGIKVCEQWEESFAQFLDDMGRRPDKTYTLDRIDCDGNYEPGNCRWASQKVQQNNRRDIRFGVVHGERLPVTQIASKYAVNERTVHHWIAKVGDGGDVTSMLLSYRPLSRPRLA